MGFLARGFGKVVLFLILAGGAYLAWIYLPALLPQVREWTGLADTPPAEDVQPSQALADSVLTRVQEFRQAGDGQIALGGLELTSVIRYSLPGLVPNGIQDLSVKLDEGRVQLSAEVVLGAFPDIPDLGPILGILPDTVGVVLLGSLLSFGEEESALLVHGVDASRIPIPRRLIPGILRGIGRVDRPGLPPEALAVPLPAGLRSAYILSDSLILSFAP